MLDMKRLIIVLAMVTLMLTACAKNVTIAPKITESPTVTTTQEGKSLFNYQGFVELRVSGIKDISRADVANVKFGENSDGIPTLHKAGKTYFNPIDIKNIKSEIDSGIKYDSFSFAEADLVKSGDAIVVKLQYLIVDVDPSLKKEEVQRKVSYTLECFNSTGKKIAAKDAEFNIPEVTGDGS